MDNPLRGASIVVGIYVDQRVKTTHLDFFLPACLPDMLNPMLSLKILRIKFTLRSYFLYKCILSTIYPNNDKLG